ncbi:Mut7-C RNAse domain-containing protein [Spirosoma soli]|uniref:Mut7-C RNAse domain-containing protein n=1 Tax=Spirosoma soli TaxID=1770529 RepID=A0ABW5LZ00_9BACT
MITANFRFYSTLNDLLPAHRQNVSFTHTFGARVSVKDVIESLGVPHPEVGLLLVNSESADFSYILRDADVVSVYPTFTELDASTVSRVQPPSLVTVRFVLDVHLGTLATYLRMLGFDTLYRNDYGDEELARISHTDTRVLLTRDRGLLMRNLVVYGYFLRNTDPQKQLIETIQRFSLDAQIQPFQRCLACNGLLAPVAKDAVIDQLPPNVRERHEQFWRCQQCKRVYWEGTHYQRMQTFVEEVRERLSM